MKPSAGDDILSALQQTYNNNNALTALDVGGSHLVGSMLAEATVLGGKDSSRAAKSTLPALGSENTLMAGDGMLISFASPTAPRDSRASPGAPASPDGRDCRPKAAVCVSVTPALTAH